MWCGEVELGASGLHLGLKAEASYGEFSGGEFQPYDREVGLICDVTHSKDFRLPVAPDGGC